MVLDTSEKLPLKPHVYTNHTNNFKIFRLRDSSLQVSYEQRGLLCGDTRYPWSDMRSEKLAYVSAPVKTYKPGSYKTPHKFTSSLDLCNREN